MALIALFYAFIIFLYLVFAIFVVYHLLRYSLDPFSRLAMTIVFVGVSVALVLLNVMSFLSINWDDFLSTFFNF